MEIYKHSPLIQLVKAFFSLTLQKNLLRKSKIVSDYRKTAAVENTIT